MIRLATEKDIPEIVRMAEQFWQYSPFPDVDYDPGSTESMAGMCIDDGLMFVADIGGIHGFICGVTAPILGNFNVLCCTEVAWWVDPEYRSTGAGIELLSALEDTAKSKGCKYCAMLFMHTSMPEQVEQIYRSRGYFEAETTHVRAL